MPLKSRLLLAVASLVVLCLMIAVLALPGCSPEPQQKKPTGQPAQSKAPAAEPAKATDPAAKKDEPAAKKDEPAKSAIENAPPLPPAPKVSNFAPAEDLAKQVDYYVKDLGKIVATEEDYKDAIIETSSRVAYDANTLVVIALNLGLHDQESKYKAQAGALIKAAQQLAATKDYESAKKGVAAVKEAAEGKAPADVELKWQKVASLPELMKEVPLINTKLKRYVKGPAFKKRAKDKDPADFSATIAAIAQGTMADTSEAKDAEQVKQWYGFSAAMRDNAGAVNAAVHADDEPAAAKAMEKLTQSCEDCHKVFKPDVKDVKEEP